MRRHLPWTTSIKVIEEVIYLDGFHKDETSTFLDDFQNEERRGHLLLDGFPKVEMRRHLPSTTKKISLEDTQRTNFRKSNRRGNLQPD